MAGDTHMGRDLSPAIRDALNQLGKAEATRQHIEKYRDSIMEALAQRRDRLEAKAAEKGVGGSRTQGLRHMAGLYRPDDGYRREDHCQPEGR